MKLTITNKGDIDSIMSMSDTSFTSSLLDNNCGGSNPDLPRWSRYKSVSLVNITATEQLLDRDRANPTLYEQRRSLEKPP